MKFIRLLRLGMVGNDVKELQRHLQKFSLYTGEIDGSFGPLTDKAVREFQSTYSLVVDGVVGPVTVNKINEILLNMDNNFSFKKIRRFNSDVYIMETTSKYFIDVELGEKNRLERLSSIISNKIKEGKKIIGGINCGFFNWNAYPEHLGMLIDDGLYYTPPTDEFIDFVYYKDGSTEIKNLHGYDGKLLSGLQISAYWAMGTSYSLIQKGTINLENMEKYSHSKYRNPRTLFGQKKEGGFLLVVVDGRRKDSLGVTAKQSADIMKELNCYNAVNLDGGGSSTMIMVANNKPKLVNRPSDGSERYIGSSLLIYEDFKA